MGIIERFPGLPPAAAARLAAKVLARHSPDEIAGAIELLIDVLDIFGGDTDAEDATDLEDCQPARKTDPLSAPNIDPTAG